MIALRHRALEGFLAFALAAILTTQLHAMELIMVEQHGCHYCEQWDEEIAPAYPKTAEGRFAPLRRVHINEIPEDLTLVSDPAFTPTFILVEDGKELARIEGYPGDDWFWPLLEALLEQNTTYMAGGS